MIDRFDAAKFEAALPVKIGTGEPLWQGLGMEGGELTYLVPVNDLVGILIRSSIGCEGIAADTGEDSIRCWLVYLSDRRPAGSKISKWTTRMPGWEKRLREVLRVLYRMGKKIRPCPMPPCNGQPLGVFLAKRPGPNKGKPFLKCRLCGHFEWLEER